MMICIFMEKRYNPTMLTKEQDLSFKEKNEILLKALEALTQIPIRGTN